MCAWLTDVVKLAPVTVANFKAEEIDGKMLLALEDGDLKQDLGVARGLVIILLYIIKHSLLLQKGSNNLDLKCAFHPSPSGAKCC